MRDVLALLDGERLAVTGTVVRFGTRPRFADLYELTLLLAEVRTSAGELLADHVWFTVGSRLAAVDPMPGDVLCFTARVRPYVKCVVQTRRNGRSVRVRAIHDFTLRFPSQVRKLAAQEVSA